MTTPCTRLLIAVLVFLWMPFALSVGAQSTTIVISEFRVRGPNGANDEFIELNNRSSAPIDISGWRIKGSTTLSSVSDRKIIPNGTIVMPGCFYLLVNAGVNGPGYSGAVAGDTTYNNEIIDGGGIAVTLPNGTTLVDSVAMSSGSPYREGTALASLGSTTASNLNRGYERKPGGTAGHTTDTDNNAADFQLVSPSNPQNSASRCIGETDPKVDGSATPEPVVESEPLLVTAHVTPGINPASANLVVTADLSSIGGSSAQSLVDDGTNGDLTAGDLVFSYQLAAVHAPVGAHTVSVHVADARARAASDAFAVTVLAPSIVYRPHDIQGAGTASPFAGQRITVEGIITGRRGDGVFVQTADSDVDADNTTSEGLFVATPAPPGAELSVGTLVRVTGMVSEYSAGGAGQTETRVSGSLSFEIVGPANLPAAVALASNDLSPMGDFDQLERFEGMRAFIRSLTAVSGTSGYFSAATGAEPSGVVTSGGAFYAVLTGTPRPMRERGLDVRLKSAFEGKCAAGPPCAIPLFDANPERLRVESSALGAPAIDVSSGVAIENVTAIVEPGASEWKLLPVPEEAQATHVGPTLTAAGAATAAPSQFTVASLNMQRFFDTVDDPATDDVPLTPQNYANRLSKASVVIRQALNLPDILAVQEVETLGALRDLAARVNADAGLPNEYSAYLIDGNDAAGLDVGFLLRQRVSVSSVAQAGKDATFVDPDDGSTDLLNDRPPLVLRATVRGPLSRLDANVIVVANHLRATSGTESTASARVRVKRQKQAEFLATLLDDLQEQGAVISVGDYNAFQHNDGLVDVIGTVRGTPATSDEVVLASPDLVEPDFADVTPAYSYVLEGNAQALDHVLLSTAAQQLFDGAQHAFINADFPEIYRNDATRVERLSDHDPVIAFFSFPPDLVAPSIRATTSSTTVLWPANHQLVNVTVSVDASDNRYLMGCRVTNATSNEPDAGTSPGDLAGDVAVIGPLQVVLRAERGGDGAGRLYTIAVACDDAAGNVTESTATVAVPHDRGKGRK